MNKNHKWYTPITNTFTHVMVGTVMFCLVAIPAVLLSFLIKWFKAIEVDGYTIQILTILEHVVVTVDVLLMLAYIFGTIARELKELKGTNNE